MGHTLPEEDIDLRCFRLRTKRQKIRAKKEAFDKALLKLRREYDAAWWQKRNLPMVELLEPIQRGWVRCFVLKQDVARSKQADFFEGILKKINTYQYSHTRKFNVKRRKNGRKIYLPRHQHIQHPAEWHFKKLKFSTREKQLFTEKLHYDHQTKRSWKIYVFLESWRFVLQIKPNLQTHVKTVNPVLESDFTKLDQYIERNHLRERINHLRGIKNWWWVERKEDPYLLKNKPLHEIMALAKEGSIHDTKTKNNEHTI